jgi:hypothetical protein
VTLNSLTSGAVRRFGSWIVVGVVLMYLGVSMFPAVPTPAGFRVADFGRLPVLVNGRVQPMDSAARVGLLQIRGTVVVSADNARPWQFWRRPLGASEWLLELLATPDAADTRRIFPIREGALLETLHLAKAGRRDVYYSFRELQPALQEIGKQTFRITKVKSTDRVAWERECLTLRNALIIYERLKNSLQPNSFLQQEARGKPIAYDFDALLKQYQVDLRAGLAAAVGREHGKAELDTVTEERLRSFARPYLSVSRSAMLAIVPPADRVAGRERWQNIGTSMVDTARTGQVPAALVHFAAMSSAFAHGKPEIFNDQVTKYRQWLVANRLAAEVSKAQYEAFYHTFQPFLRALAIYAGAFALLCAALIRRSTRLYRPAVMLVALAFVLHTAGLLFEMMLEGRPPVTNIYAVIISAGWLLVVLAGGIERVLRNRIGTIAAALAGVTALTVSHSMAPGGASELMRSVLSGSFWLTCAAVIAVLYVGRHAGDQKRGGPREEPGPERLAYRPWRVFRDWPAIARPSSRD